MTASQATDLVSFRGPRSNPPFAAPRVLLEPTTRIELVTYGLRNREAPTHENPRKIGVKRSSKHPLQSLLPSLLPNRQVYGHFYWGDRCRAVGEQQPNKTVAVPRGRCATSRHRSNHSEKAGRAVSEVRTRWSSGSQLRRGSTQEVGGTVEGPAQRWLGRGRVRHSQDRSIGSILAVTEVV